MQLQRSSLNAVLVHEGTAKPLLGMLFTLHQASHAQQRLVTTTTVTLVPSVYPRSRTRKFEKRGYMAWLLNLYKMAAVLTEEPRLEEKSNEMPDEADDEIEDPQETGGESSSKKKKKKKKKKKGRFDFKQVCLEKKSKYFVIA